MSLPKWFWIIFGFIGLIFIFVPGIVFQTAESAQNTSLVVVTAYPTINMGNFQNSLLKCDLPYGIGCQLSPYQTRDCTISRDLTECKPTLTPTSRCLTSEDLTGCAPTITPTPHCLTSEDLTGCAPTITPTPRCLTSEDLTGCKPTTEPKLNCNGVVGYLPCQNYQNWYVCDYTSPYPNGWSWPC